MTKKQGIRTIIFICLFVVIFMGINTFMRSPEDRNKVQAERRYDELYTDPKDTWEGVLIGASMVDRAWAAPYAWDQYGMTVYALGMDAYPFMMTDYVLDEVLTRQDISFVAVEMHCLCSGSLERDETQIRWTTEYIRSPLIKIKSILHAFSYSDEWHPGTIPTDMTTRLSYFFPVIKFHTRLTNGTYTKWDYDVGQTNMKGVFRGTYYASVTPITLEPFEEIGTLNEEQTALLDEIIAYCADKGIELVFYSTPGESGEEDNLEINAIGRYAEEKGCLVLNFNEEAVLEASDVDADTDFINRLHMNALGARHFTDYFSEWLHENLDLEDHRGEEDYASWDSAWSKYEKFFGKALEKIEEKT